MDEACGAKGNIVVIGDEGATGEVEISMARIYFRGERSVYWERRYFDRPYSGDERIPRLRQLPPGHRTPLRCRPPGRFAVRVSEGGGRRTASDARCGREDLERTMVRDALDRHPSVASGAGELGITRQGLSKLMARLRLDRFQPYTDRTTPELSR